jgi:hypothetical protein
MSHKLLWLFNFIISLKIILVKKHFLNMFRNTIFLLTTLSLISCKKPKDKIEDIVYIKTVVIGIMNGQEKVLNIGVLLLSL